MQFTLEDISDDEIARRRAIYEPLTDSVRQLIDAVIRTEVPDDVVAAARERIDDIVDTLRAEQIDGPYGVRYTPDFVGMPWGNSVVGVRNAIAPPLRTRHDGHEVSAEFTLGAAYEGPGDHVHGGVAAMILDQVLGEAASVDNVPCYTGTISLRYVRPTPLGPLTARASIVGRDGRKKTVRGTLADTDGVTVEAEGVFIVPRDWTGRMPRASKDHSPAHTQD
ncbi:MAG TPA: PaaI family thioesterase [Gordonia polyisoprenivorans]|uniref:PaaI family thioesterase n=1 Tax=Gordonia TaxID=2053 RepID=UPI0009AEE2B3|nr:PaaI family thioesterase [Gordonia sp. i37]OPX16503.1 thioesterase [Gordonia sp. i37]UZF55077.1 PaaI family thioesterase [Gordonia polyisoprenivorans]HCS55973.1 PaaI family thioesterase [Gordonia polyisoprenivorans]